jgi:hypothetical protein
MRVPRVCCQPGWISWARRCRLPAFVELAATITRYPTLILNAVEHSLSNARFEATKPPWYCDHVVPEVSFGSLTGTPGSEYMCIPIITDYRGVITRKVDPADGVR